MKRLSLNERFSCIKAVTADSTESDTDFSDVDLIPRSSSNRFSYTKIASLSFTGNQTHSTVEGDDDDNDDDDTCDEMIDMEEGWMAHFKKILQKSRNLRGEHESHVSLCDKVPQVDKSLPLQCLKKSLEQYNKQSQDEVNEDLTLDDLTLERNETGTDFCEEYVANENIHEPVVDVLEQDAEKNIDSVNEDVANIEEDTEVTEKVLEPVGLITVNNKADINEQGSIVKSDQKFIVNNEENVDHYDTDTEYIQNEIEVEQDYEDLSVLKFTDECETLHTCIQKHVCNSQDNTGFGEEQSEITAAIEDEIPEVKSKILDEKSENTLRSVDRPSVDYTENKTFVLNQSMKSCQNEFNSKGTLSADSTQDLQKVKTSAASTAAHLEIRTTGHDSVENPVAINETEAKLVKDSGDVTSKLCAPADSKQDKENKKKVTQSLSKVKNASHKKEKVKSISVTQSKKEAERKPTFTFPLDELLPLIPVKTHVAEENVKSSVSKTALHNYTNESRKKEIQETIVSYPVAPHSFNEGEIFHGTVYESSPNYVFPNTEQQQQSNYEVASCSKHSDNEFDPVMANLITALQSGNHPVISMFQAALQDQIGINLETLAIKAREGQQVAPKSDYEEPQSFGFYKEREEKVDKDQNETGDNLASEKYEELFNLFIEQCSALVKTEEDRRKVKSLMKVLQKEGERQSSGTGFTPPSAETNTDLNIPNDSSDDEEAKGSQDICQGDGKFQDTELFEGRTLLKGGVDPRHIPKTTIRKTGQELPTDPRPIFYREKCNSVVKVPLPEFAIELYGERKIERILHLDWDAKLSDQQIPSTLMEESGQEMKTNSPIHIDLKHIVETTKRIVENLQASEQTAAIERKQNKSKTVTSVDTTSSQSNKITVKFTDISKNDTEKVQHKTIPVVITPLKELKTSKPLNSSSKDRNSVLQSVDLKHDSTTDLDKKEKKLCIGIVKPIIDHHKSKDTKPSVGIVKPIQIKIRSEKHVSTCERRTVSPSTSNTHAFNKDLDHDMPSNIPVCEGVRNKNTDKISPSGTNRQSVIIVLDSDSEEGEIKVEEERQSSAKETSKFKSKSAGGHKSKKNDQNDQKDFETAAKALLKKVRNVRKVDNSFSDISSDEEGEIDTLLDKPFTEAPIMIKQKGDRNKEHGKMQRQYRKRDRSSSRSSVDSRLSHSSSRNERKYVPESTRHSKSREKSHRKDRSFSRERTRYASPSHERGHSKSKHRQRHHTGKDERSYKESSERSGTSKRHHSVGDEKRKRHKTDEDKPLVKKSEKQYTEGVFMKPLTNQRSENILDGAAAESLLGKTKLSQISSVSHMDGIDDHILSDDDISKEYHEKFGQSKREKLVIHVSTKDTLIESKTSSKCPIERENPLFSKSISRRKSLEDKQKEVIDDMKFLEKCKQKILGVTSKPALNNEAKSSTTSKKETTVNTPKKSSCAFSYNDMLQLADLEDGEIKL